MVWASVGLALLGSNSPMGVLSTYLYVFLYSLLNKELSPLDDENDLDDDYVDDEYDLDDGDLDGDYVDDVSLDENDLDDYGGV